MPRYIDLIKHLRITSCNAARRVPTNSAFRNPLIENEAGVALTDLCNARLMTIKGGGELYDFRHTESFPLDNAEMLIINTIS